MSGLDQLGGMMRLMGVLADSKYFQDGGSDQFFELTGRLAIGLLGRETDELMAFGRVFEKSSLDLPQMLEVVQKHSDGESGLINLPLLCNELDG